MNETIYTSYSQLRRPRNLLRELAADLRATRDLGWRLFITNLRAQYRQSWFGYIWLLVPPFLTGLVWVLLDRSQVIVSNTVSYQYPIFVLSGIFIWQTFVEAINMPIAQLTAQKAVLSKFKVPHEAFLVSGLGQIVFNLLLRVAALLILLLVFRVTFTPAILLFPFGLFSIILFGLAIGLFLTPIGLLYADIKNGINAVVSLWFFVTPIIYQIPERDGVWTVLKYNPITPLLNTTRQWLISGIYAPDVGFFFVSALAVVLLIVSWLFYRLAKPHLIARISA